MGELCEICGDGGFEECTVTCDQCKVASQHVYCMRHNSLVVPEIWFCEECCLSNHLLVELPIENKKSVAIEQEPTLQALFSPSLTTDSQRAISSCSSPRKGHTGQKGKKLSGSGHVSEREPSNPLVVQEEARFPQTKARKRVTFAPQSVIISDVKFCSDAKSRISDIQESPPSYDLLHFEKYPSNRPNLEAIWNGRFEILDMIPPGELYVGFRAHLPCVVDRKVYELSKQMPEVLQFKLLPCSEIWAEIFQNGSALGCDISLYFFPGKCGRSLQQYVSLLGLIEMQDLVMRSCINGLELLIFASNRLHYAEELNWISFLWGVFRSVKNKNTVYTPSCVRTSQDYPQSSNAGATVLAGQNSSELKNKSLDGLYVPQSFSEKAARKSTDDLNLEKISSDLVEVPVEIYPLGAFHNVKNEKAVASPGVWTSEDHYQTNNAGTAVRQYSSEVKNSSLDGLYVPQSFSEMAARKSTDDLNLETISSDLVEVPVEIHPLGAFHNVKNEKAVAPPGVWTSEDHDQTYNAGTAALQYSSEANNKLADGHYFHLGSV